MKLEKIADRIYLLKGSTSSNIYYFDFKKKAILDTGHPLERSKIFSFFKKKKFPLDKIDYIINTHSHGDHVGSNAFLKKQNSTIKIIGSSRTHEYQDVRKSVSLLKGAEDDFEEYKIDIFAKDNDKIDLGDFVLDVIETPGHTRDSISLYSPRDKFLFSGDLIYYRVVAQLDYYQDLKLSLEEAVSSYKKLKNLDISRNYTGHGDYIFDPHRNMDLVLRKMGRLGMSPEMLIINNLIPSCEFFIGKNKGCTVFVLKTFLEENLEKAGRGSVFNNMSKEKFGGIFDKMLSLMKIMKIIKEKNEKLYLTRGVNKHIGIRKI